MSTATSNTAPARHPHQFPLRLLDLVVQAPQRVAHRVAVVVLHELHVDAGGGELALLPGFEEEAARIAEHLRPDQDDVGNRGGFKLHLVP